MGRGMFIFQVRKISWRGLSVVWDATRFRSMNIPLSLSGAVSYSGTVTDASLQPALFMRVRHETAETPYETGAWSGEGGRHP